MLAEATGESLRDDQCHRRSNIKSGDAHVQESRDRLGCIVGMHGRHHQVPRLGRFDGNFRGLQIANFSDHDDVWVLAEKGAQRLGKVEPHLGVHQHLIDALHIDFHGIFSSRNIALGFI